MAVADKTLQTSQCPLTVRGFESFSDDGNRYEIMGGLLSVSLSPTLEHQRIAGRMYAALERYFDKAGGGEALPAPVDVELKRRFRKPGSSADSRTRQNRGIRV